MLTFLNLLEWKNERQEENDLINAGISLSGAKDSLNNSESSNVETMKKKTRNKFEYKYEFETHAACLMLK